MKRILILSYFFPPCNLTASQRALGWAKHLKKFGFYPVIITRNWDIEINNPKDALKSAGERIIHIQHADYEVYYLSYKANLRDRLYVKYGDNKFVFIRKLLTLIELTFQNFTNFVIPFKNIYAFAYNFIRKNPDIKLAIITANPFIFFRFGYLLNKKLKIKWIADYRDDWNTSEVNNHTKNPIQNLLSSIETISEKKWIASAEINTTISDYYARKIALFTNKKTEVLLNGYFEDDFIINKGNELNKYFTIVYNGTLYPTQKIELFLSALKKLIDLYDTEIDSIRMIFPGLEYDKTQLLRVSNYMKSYESKIITSPRVSRTEIIELQSKSHALLMIAHDNTKGIPSSKLYEYIAIGKPIIVCPTDNDIIENTLAGYNLGYICETEEKAFAALQNLYEIYKRNKYKDLKPDEDFKNQFSRQKQTEKLAAILNSL